VGKKPPEWLPHMAGKEAESTTTEAVDAMAEKVDQTSLLIPYKVG
jgi:hypothetical protein